MPDFSQAIFSGDYDSQQSGSTITLDGGALNANGTTGLIGLYFLNSYIPKNSTINTASLNCYFTSGSFDDPNVRIYAALHYAAPFLSTTSNDLSSRGLTTAYATWNAASLGIGWETSPSLVAPLQELVDYTYWRDYSSTGNILLIIKGMDAGSLMRIRSYEGSSSEAAVLNINYTEPSGGTAIAVYQYHYRRQRRQQASGIFVL